MNYNSHPFGRGDIDDVFRYIKNKIEEHIEGENDDYILNVNLDDYANHLKSQYEVTEPIIDFDSVRIDETERMIPAERFPFTYGVREGRSYKMQVIILELDIIQGVEELRRHPARQITLSGHSRFNIEQRRLVYEYINFDKKGEEIRREFDNAIESLKPNYERLRSDIRGFNNTIISHVQAVFKRRKDELLKNKSILSSIGIPLKRDKNASQTFAVPSPQVRQPIRIERPKVQQGGFTPEPTIDNTTYQNILKIINDVGKNFERYTSLYQGKGEEDLRDHILMFLDPNFEMGSASGETFNKTGKTDILIRYDSSVLFVAECKFWSGPKNYLKTISQLINYLTWRDTKTSVIIFVKQKDISAIIEKVKEETSKHDNFLKFCNQTDENWFNYEFHLNGDRNRIIKMAIQLYHIPQ